MWPCQTDEQCRNVLSYIYSVFKHVLVIAVYSQEEKMPCPNSQQILYQRSGTVARPGRITEERASKVSASLARDRTSA
jgi:hypothetical protein